MPLIEVLRMLLEEVFSCRTDGVFDKIVPHPLLDALVDFLFGLKEVGVDDQVVHDTLAADGRLHQDAGWNRSVLEEASVGEDREFLMNPNGAPDFRLFNIGVVDHTSRVKHGEVSLAHGKLAKDVVGQFVEAVGLRGEKWSMATFRQEAL